MTPKMPSLTVGLLTYARSTLAKLHYYPILRCLAICDSLPMKAQSFLAKHPAEKSKTAGLTLSLCFRTVSLFP